MIHYTSYVVWSISDIYTISGTETTHVFRWSVSRMCKHYYYIRSTKKINWYRLYCILVLMLLRTVVSGLEGDQITICHLPLLSLQGHVYNSEMCRINLGMAGLRYVRAKWVKLSCSLLDTVEGILKTVDFFEKSISGERQVYYFKMCVARNEWGNSVYSGRE